MAETIWNTTPAGIELTGSESAVVTDDAGNSQTVLWDWVAEDSVAVVVNISGIDNTADNTAAIKAAALAFFDALGVGEDVAVVRVVSAVVAAMGDDVLSCTATVGGLSTVYSVDGDELAVTATGSITVNYV